MSSRSYIHKHQWALHNDPSCQEIKLLKTMQFWPSYSVNATRELIPEYGYSIPWSPCRHMDARAPHLDVATNSESTSYAAVTEDMGQSHHPT
mgnify:CR=1 FL=1